MNVDGRITEPPSACSCGWSSPDRRCRRRRQGSYTTRGAISLARNGSFQLSNFRMGPPGPGWVELTTKVLVVSATQPALSISKRILKHPRVPGGIATGPSFPPGRP